MVYPYMISAQNLREQLIANKIFIAHYWPNVLEWCGKSDWEYGLAENLVCLPIDQRYGDKEMNRIIEILQNEPRF